MRCTILLTLLLSTATVLGQPPRSYTTWIAPLNGPFHELTADEENRLVVEWDKPELQTDDIRSRLVISGSMLLQSQDGTTKTPVDWVQPVNVIIVRHHEDKPDWSQGFDEKQCAGTQASTSVDGRFRIVLLLNTIRREPGAAKAFQVALSLGTRQGNEATWTNRTPVLANSVSALVIPGPSSLSKTLQLINGASSHIGYHFNPVAVVRAVNHLRSIGKEKTIAALREYLSIAHDPGNFVEREPEPDNLDTSNQDCVKVLIPLLFESSDPHERVPGEGHFLSVEQDIPFHNVYFGHVSGLRAGRRDLSPLVDWAEKHGKMITTIWKPAPNILEVADQLRQRLGKTSPTSEDDYLKGHLRMQAWRAVRHLVDPDDESNHAVLDRFFHDANWSNLRRKADQQKIRWNEELQDYVAEITSETMTRIEWVRTWVFCISLGVTVVMGLVVWIRLIKNRTT
jgi:hypothetical protein